MGDTAFSEMYRWTRQASGNTYRLVRVSTERGPVPVLQRLDRYPTSVESWTTISEDGPLIAVVEELARWATEMGIPVVTFGARETDGYYADVRYADGHESGGYDSLLRAVEVAQWKSGSNTTMVKHGPDRAFNE